ncbi:MAG TPA: coproporphyrinogen-III oxidase family protein [Candidatus Baltobacteraceae bacterium]|jgi:oxygen-independent coproporphyrinogen-3 oxidase|nr:coproporphyrinogen-III oxidase family protein [Candidatus Baltobacteraceae bacterium]
MTSSETIAPPAPPIEKQTTVGNYFVSNYPPFSFWKPEYVPELAAALDRPPAPATPLGVYLHIPFCRKRCHFCYFKVYTDKDSAAIRGYIDAALRELAVYAEKPIIGGRKANFVYFGGGTPSYLSVDQLRQLTDGMKKLISWDGAEEVTFECEPGTLTGPKLKAIREMGVTRLSLGVENFDDHILEINGRAHHSKEIARAYGFARELDFPQINIDLIAGMVEETEANWRQCVRKTIEMSPDSVTIYQMEVPYNTTIYKEMKESGKLVAPVADWETKRAWVAWGFAELEKAGYTVGSAYTAVKNKDKTRFVYRDRLWAGADLIGLGVASFGHLQGTHYQNLHDFEPYVNAVRSGQPPVYRALTPNADERLIREFILQLKLGQVHCDYFQKKFGVDVRQRFAQPLQTLRDWGFGGVEGDTVRLNREGLLQVDRLLHEFFLPEHRNARYA